MPTKKIIFIIIGLIVIALLVAGYFYFMKSKSGAVKTAEEVSNTVPEIQTNPGEKVPEINPLDRANPFKYKNPLR